MIRSDGGPGHFKVYKTQRWMTEFQQTTIGTTWEWNMCVPYQGHNLCDTHAGHAKQKVRKQGKKFHLTETIDDVVTAIAKLSNMEVIHLDKATILSNDEPQVMVQGNHGFICSIFHFKYPVLNQLHCKRLKTEGAHQTYTLRQVKSLTQEGLPKTNA